MQRMPAYTVKPAAVIGFHTNGRQKYVHLVIGAEYPVAPCGKSIDTVIPLDAFPRLDWRTVCPTCLAGVEGFLDYWRREHQPIPY